MVLLVIPLGWINWIRQETDCFKISIRAAWRDCAEASSRFVCSNPSALQAGVFMIKETRGTCPSSQPPSKDGRPEPHPLLLVYSRETFPLSSAEEQAQVSHEKVSAFSLTLEASGRPALLAEFQPRWQNWTNWVLMTRGSRPRTRVASRGSPELMTEWESR